ncbi:hypothetical protein BU23DRAFT_158395 [Bimuria novae-zelandiae CBS 107.79]|uniref:Uncharacterized protein n=1 Tax=Bimuria novae-zelandiae CBS 107.79 TaxID=1447943 RepID=A0A6A5V905_9PLEO|nr:hypothetical protein BU23DRAFT_158395 [Bimuria novae-zelandiae CBS 107.79]
MQRELRVSFPSETKTVVHFEGLDRRRAHSDPIPHLRLRLSSGWLRHITSMPVEAPTVVAKDGTRPTVPAGSRQPEPLRRPLTNNTGGDSDAAHEPIGRPSLVVRPACTAPNTCSKSSVVPDSLRTNAQTQGTLTLKVSPSAGSMQIALAPRFSHQYTSIPTQHATKGIALKSPSRHIKSHSVPRLTINIPQKQNNCEQTVINMATLEPLSPTTRKSSRPREKRVSFTTAEPELIPSAPSKRRQSSVNQRPSWSNVFLLRDPKVRDDVAARSRSLSPGPSILKEYSAFKSDASDADLAKDEHGNEQPRVHVSPLYEKNLKRLSRGRPKTSLPIPQAKVSRNADPRAMSPAPDLSPSSLSARHASPREDSFDKSPSSPHDIVVHPPSPPESDAESDEDEEAIEDSDEQSPRQSRNSSLDDVADDDAEVEALDSRFSKCDIDGSSHAHRHEKRKDSHEEPKSPKDDWRTSRKSSANDDWRTSRKSSNAPRKSSTTSSRKDSQESNKASEKPAIQRRRSSSADQAEMWLRRSSIYGVRSRTPRVPTRLGSLRA